MYKFICSIAYLGQKNEGVGITRKSKELISDQEKVWQKITLMPSSSGELPSLGLKLDSVILSYTLHMEQKQCLFRSFPWPGIFISLCPTDCRFWTLLFWASLMWDWMTSKVCRLDASPFGFLVTMLQDLLPAVQLVPRFVYSWSLCNHSFYGASLRTANLCPNLASLEHPSVSPALFNWWTW